jgi:type III restriction enzyme
MHWMYKTMNSFEPKIYQQQVLESCEAYFRSCHEMPSPSVAFNAVTEQLWGKGQSYNTLSGFPVDMPYFCLRIPTGGGKTWLAAKSVALINTHLMRIENSVILWLVPSNQIREQTLRGLQDLNHPLHTALKDAGQVTVLSLDEAKSVTRATLDTSTTVIVATRQAFQVEDADVRKVYNSNGALMHHFENLSSKQRAELLKDGETTPYSLANVLRLRRPFVIVDEAHNSRTDLGFETLARFRPSGIMELTATPDLEKTPSNVLHSVSAAELKAEEMIKLPIRLETEPKWHQCLADAIARRDELQQLSNDEHNKGAAYLRPIILIQAEPKRQNVETLDVSVVRQELIDNHRIPEDEIIVATGEEKGLQKIDKDYARGIADSDCPVKFIITQKALAEGWDCPSAYILVSMASLHSSTAVEQLLGRILRQPDASHREAIALNQSYAFVVSRNFAETASTLRDRLIQGAGFERKEAAQFVTAEKPQQGRIDIDGLGERVEVRPIQVNLPTKPNFKGVPKPVKDKVEWDNKKKTLTISKPLTEDETEVLKATVKEVEAQEAISQAAEISRTTAIEHFQTPAELGESFNVPHMVLNIQGELQLFDDPELLDYPWDLSLHDTTPTKNDLSALDEGLKVAEGGDIDVTDEGKVVTRFIADLQRDLSLVYKPENWDDVKLSAWWCRNLPDPTITHESKRAFVAGWLNKLLEKENFELARANQQKFLIRNLLEQRINELRKESVNKAYQETLFGDSKDISVEVNDSCSYEFHPHVYSPSKYYDSGKWGYVFKKHYYGEMGDFDTKEEFECACWLDQQAENGLIKYWIRNLVRKKGCSFFLQKADGKFYPDFICKLPDDTILVVEYKGADRWDTPKVKADRLIGNLWAELSNGNCHFIMIKDKKWNSIAEILGTV